MPREEEKQRLYEAIKKYSDTQTSQNKLQTKTWCYCTAGNSKAIFDFVFGYEVDVELLKSIKMGDTFCLMKVSKKR